MNGDVLKSREKPKNLSSIDLGKSHEASRRIKMSRCYIRCSDVWKAEKVKKGNKNQHRADE